MNFSQQQRYPHSPISNSIEDGAEFVDFVMPKLLTMGFLVQVNTSAKYQLANGESSQGWEIKLDRRCTETGRLSIEVAERSSRDVQVWTRSGIYAPSRFYVQGNYTVFYVFATRDLRDIHRVREKELFLEFNGTVRRFFLSLRDAEHVCQRKWVVRPDNQIALPSS